ncbi:M48 family metallopeptidase [Flavobacterium sp. xlx-214]|uniref:M48 family metallopeptidase n=1 Tax=unclassified Flavobacterium TaxID=196869 RepID=UPI0013D614BE|nr:MULTISPECIES: M48 family metallopeptidase [unclassified Flavobacterium]MBA5793161.1 M48 family metallopeptidase [Flavobacterium sp. xlx-221]QMI82555.1 M48 family metallopeptidase [Flavobacterium sp. xlx-214]
MKKVFVLCSIAALAIACATNPLTGKKGIALTNENEQLIPAAYQQYSTFLKENKVISGTADAQKVQTVGAKIKAAAEQWMTSRGFGSQIANYKWEYKLVDSKEINAWCMPGGKIAVYSGIMPVTKDEAGLATVMGHEVAHALLSHSRKRMDKALIQAGVGEGLGQLTSGSSGNLQKALGLAYGVGSNLAMLSYSRGDESEADRLGLILMAIAGYNPDTAINFWERMSAQGGGKTPELLSTHPSDKTRIADIQKLIPEAKAEAAKFGKKF